MEFRDTEVKVLSVTDTHIKMQIGNMIPEVAKTDLQAMMDGTVDSTDHILFNIAVALKLAGTNIVDDVAVASALSKRTFKIPR
jgi:hypothetical protein